MKEKVAGLAGVCRSQKTTFISEFQRPPGLLAPHQGGRTVKGNGEITFHRTGRP